MNYLFVDFGSTFIKYGVYDDSSGEIIVQGKLPFPEPLLCDEKNYIVSGEEIRRKILSAFEITTDYKCRKAYFSVQMHGYILRDVHGRFSDYVSWRDKTGNINNDKLKDIDFNRMGTSLKNNLPLIKLFEGNFCGEFFTLGSYISYILTGKNATHITDACASGFYYADSGKKNEYTGYLKMPEAYKDIKTIGIYSGAEIYTPVGDHQASFLGSNAKEDGYLVNIGTATQISCVYGSNYPSGDYEKRPFFNNDLLYTVSGLIGGDKLYQNQGEKELLEQIINAIDKLPPKNEVVFGGGGALQVFDFLKNELVNRGFSCTLAENNIGMRGLKMIAENNRIKAGTMLSEVRFSNFPIIAKNSGLDFVILDNEHGCFDYSDISALVVTANLIDLELIVRIGDSSRGHITKLADMGVRGFLLPMTNNREDIQKVVDYAKYTPIGKRGVSTTRAHTLYNPPKLTDYMKSANEKMKIYAQIETVSGIQNIDSILGVDGVDGIFIGPNDLSVDMNCISDKKKICDAIETIAESAHRINKPFGIITGDRELIECSVRNNVGMISMGSELNMLINGCKKIKEAVCEY